MIEIQWQGQDWDKPEGPWTDSTATVSDPIEALQLMGAIVHYGNTRPVSWAAETANEALFIGHALHKRPYMREFVQAHWNGPTRGESPIDL